MVDLVRQGEQAVATPRGDSVPTRHIPHACRNREFSYEREFFIDKILV